MRTHDGSAGNVDYGTIGSGYRSYRRPDERIARGIAEELAFADGQFDAAMTLFSVHQWSDAEAGLREMRRVTRGPVTVLT